MAGGHFTKNGSFLGVSDFQFFFLKMAISRPIFDLGACVICHFVEQFKPEKLKKTNFRIYRIFRIGIFKSMFWTFWSKSGLTYSQNFKIGAFLESSWPGGSETIEPLRAFFHAQVRIFQNVVRKTGYQKLIEGVVWAKNVTSVTPLKIASYAGLGVKTYRNASKLVVMRYFVFWVFSGP